MKYNIISSDDHLQEGPDVWTSRMSKLKWGEHIPQLRHNEGGTDSWWAWGDKIGVGVGHVNAALPDRASTGKGGATRWDEVPEITYVPSERIKAMDRDGVDVHAFFANIAGSAGGTFNAPKYPEQFRLECIQAFNDHQIEDWATPYPGRFITLAQIPLWDVKLAVAELRRTAKLGIKAITYALPQQFGYPHIADPVWDPFWDAAQETNLSINLHLGSGGSQGLGANLIFEGLPPMFHLSVGGTNAAAANSQLMATVLFSGILDRFPRLKFVSSESGLGWAPYVLENADYQWAQMNLSREGMALSPTDYFHRQCYINFWYEILTDLMQESIGIDSIMWLSDFPHPTSTWPNSREYLDKSLVHVTPEERRRILVDTPARVFNLDPS